MVIFAEEEQAALEAKAVARWAPVERGELSATSAMGTPEEWTIEIGAHRLLLVPSTREWLFYDHVHDSWESTGYIAGAVQFGVCAGELGVRRTVRVAYCGRCGARATAGDRFCGACGEAHL
jgi:hypothetical protein